MLVVMGTYRNKSFLHGWHCCSCCITVFCVWQAGASDVLVFVSLFVLPWVPLSSWVGRTGIINTRVSIGKSIPLTLTRSVFNAPSVFWSVAFCLCLLVTGCLRMLFAMVQQMIERKELILFRKISYEINLEMIWFLIFICCNMYNAFFLFPTFHIKREKKKRFIPWMQIIYGLISFQDVFSFPSHTAEWSKFNHSEIMN